MKGILCFHCVKTFTIKKCTLSKPADESHLFSDSSSFRGRTVSLTKTTVPHLVDSERESNQSSAGTGAKANELKERFEKGKTVPGLLLAVEVIEILECLNKSLQKQTETVAGRKSAIV